MVIVSRQRVLEQLNEVGLMPIMLRSVQRGWDRYQKKVAGTFKSPTARTRANVVRDYVVEDLKTSTQGIEGVKFVENGDRALLYVGTEIVVEVHKLNEDRVATRNQTAFAELLKAQQLSIGVANVAVLTLGYTHDKPAVNLRDVLLVCTRDGKPVWDDIDLQQEAGATIAPVSRAEPSTGTRPRVTGKPGVKPVKKKDEDGEK